MKPDVRVFVDAISLSLRAAEGMVRTINESKNQWTFSLAPRVGTRRELPHRLLSQFETRFHGKSVHFLGGEQPQSLGDPLQLPHGLGDLLMPSVSAWECASFRYRTVRPHTAALDCEKTLRNYFSRDWSR
jgi:hypothetical protein